MPKGLVNVVPTTTSGEWLDAVVDHRAVRMLSFTGSTEVGRMLLRRAADRVLKTVMELGGNAPFIVFDDADIDAAVEGAMVAKMRHSAETCTAANRFYVETGVLDEFSEKFTAAMSNVKVGNGFDEGVTCGPLINKKAVADVDGLVQGAVEGRRLRAARRRTAAGRRVLLHPHRAARRRPCGGDRQGGDLRPGGADHRLHRHDDMIRQANDTELGLTGYVYTRDLAKGLRVSEQIQAGMIGLNRGAVSDPAAPFGGMKQSGLGREGSTEGIYEFCETQYIATNW